MSPPDTKAADAASRFAWIETVALDPRSSALSIRVAVALSAMMGSAGYAFPSYDALASITGASRKAVMETVVKLAQNGHLTIDRDPRPGRSRVNRYRRVAVADSQPVWTAWRAWKQSRTGDPLSADEGFPDPQEESPFTEKGSPPEDRKSHPQVTRTLKGNPVKEPGSEPNGSADADAPAFHQDDWKGSEGERIPAGFPDQEAMQDASMWAHIAGVDLDLKQVRKTFLNHHFAVRCRQRDWGQSWERWVDQAITEATA
ncbi:MAG: hypothetical protein H2039_00865 [Brevundimonas sp.]|nr:hypothetical protein [Brevundimonas sp.]